MIVSLFIAVHAAYFFMSNWLVKYEYRTEIARWIFVIVGAGALLIPLLTVRYQSIKAALGQPGEELENGINMSK